MSDERERHHQQIEALRAARLAESAAAAELERVRERQEQQPVNPAPLAAAVAKGTRVGATMFVLLLVMLVLLLDDSPRHAVVALAAGLASVAGFLWRAARAGRDGVTLYRRWLGSLPFPVRGLTAALAAERAVTEVHVDLSFADTRASPGLLAEALRRAALPNGTEPGVSATRQGLQLRFSLDAELTNAPLHALIAGLVNRVLVRVHAEYPLKAVEVRVVETWEFAGPPPE